MCGLKKLSCIIRFTPRNDTDSSADVAEALHADCAESVELINIVFCQMINRYLAKANRAENTHIRTSLTGWVVVTFEADKGGLLTVISRFFSAVPLHAPHLGEERGGIRGGVRGVASGPEKLRPAGIGALGTRDGGATGPHWRRHSRRQGDSVSGACVSRKLDLGCSSEFPLSCTAEYLSDAQLQEKLLFEAGRRLKDVVRSTDINVHALPTDFDRPLRPLFSYAMYSFDNR